MYIIEFTEIICGSGRLFTQFAMYMMGVYIALYSGEWATKWQKLAMNIVLDLFIVYNNMIWVQYSQEDFNNYKLHGDYQVGFKRFKAEEGNDCLVFYPVNKGTRQVPCTPFKNVEKYIKGNKLIGLAPGQQGSIIHRTISKLSPNAPLANDFSTGKHKLIPMVHVHGNMASSNEHTAVPM